MRSLHITETLVGGVGTYVNALGEALIQEFGAGSLLIVAPSRGSDQLTAIGPAQTRIFRQTGRNPASINQFVQTIARAIIEFRPEIIHLHGTFAGLIGRPLAAVLSRAPQVYCPHGWAFDMEQSALSSRSIQVIELILAPLANKIIAISQHEMTQARIIGISEGRMRLVRNGVPDLPEKFSVRETGGSGLNLLFVGRPDRQKGLDLLLEAAPALADVASVRIAGVRPEQLASLGVIPENVTALGWLSASDVASEIDASDAVIVPSRWEGFGLVAIEAMRSGRCVIAANVGGLRELIIDGENGRIIPAPVTPKGIADVVRTVTRAKAAQMGRAGRKDFVRQYRFNRVREEILAMYATILKP